MMLMVLVADADAMLFRGGDGWRYLSKVPFFWWAEGRGKEKEGVGVGVGVDQITRN